MIARLPRPLSEFRGGPFKWFPTASEGLVAAVGEWLATGERPGA